MSALVSWLGELRTLCLINLLNRAGTRREVHLNEAEQTSALVTMDSVIRDVVYWFTVVIAGRPPTDDVRLEQNGARQCKDKGGRGPAGGRCGREVGVGGR